MGYAVEIVRNSVLWIVNSPHSRSLSLLHTHTHTLTHSLTHTRVHTRTHRVSDTVNATESRNGRWQPVVVIGQIPTPLWPRRPAIVLAPSTAGFNDPSVAKPVLLFITNWCLEPGPGENILAKGCDAVTQPSHDWHSSAYQVNLPRHSPVLLPCF